MIPAPIVGPDVNSIRLAFTHELRWWQAVAHYTENTKLNSLQLYFVQLHFWQCSCVRVDLPWHTPPRGGRGSEAYFGVVHPGRYLMIMPYILYIPYMFCTSGMSVHIYIS